MALHCLYFALQRCSSAVVTDFLPLIEIRVGVWRDYMQRLCHHSDHNSNNQVSNSGSSNSKSVLSDARDQLPSEPEAEKPGKASMPAKSAKSGHDTTKSELNNIQMDNTNTKEPTPSRVSGEKTIHQGGKSAETERGAKSEVDLQETSTEEQQADLFETSSKFVLKSIPFEKAPSDFTDNLQLLTEKNLMEAKLGEIDCSTAGNAASLQCAHIASLLSSTASCPRTQWLWLPAALAITAHVILTWNF